MSAPGRKTTSKARIITLLASLLLLAPALLWSQATQQEFDFLIKDGTVYDGTGGAPIRADVGIRGDRIVAVGTLEREQARTVVDASGLAVAPGFINMLSWSVVSLIADGRSQSEIRQGVTTEIFGEGTSMGPLNEPMRRRAIAAQTDFKYEIPWTTLAEYLAYLEKRGVSPNVASFIGAATIRTHVLGLEDVQPTPEQLEQMRELVRREMEAGALGIGSALIYAPGTYAKTEELVELCKVAAKYQGKYISHIRSEGRGIIQAIEELIRISREAGLPAEIYHLKVAGAKNWGKMDQVISVVRKARREGLKITANMYLYTAGSTGLSSVIPAWAHSGGNAALFQRLQEPATRAKIAKEMRTKDAVPRTLLVGFRSETLRPLTGKTLEEVAAMRGEDLIETILNLVLEDRSPIQVVFFSMNEDSLKKGLREPWVSIGSDGPSIAPEGVFLKRSTHPRAYGNFARLLGKYVREEKVLSLQEAVRRLTGQPATNLGLDHRGFIRDGMFADVVVFDAATIADRATYEDPHQYSIGMKHVFVNGAYVLKDGEHTGARPGRALWGPGKVKGGARPRSGVHSSLFQIQLPFEVPQHLVADLTLGPKAAERLAFGVDDRSSDLAVLDELSIIVVGGRGIALPLEVLRTVLVGIAQPVEKWAVPRPHGIELIESPRGGFEQPLPGARFFLAPFGIGPQAKAPDEPRQAQPLAQQREDDDRERDDDERFARGERPAARQRDRQGERGGE